MIYKSLHTLPMVICDEILRTGNLSLLSTEFYPIGDLAELWEKLEEQLKKISNTNGHDKVFSISKECEYLANKYDHIHMIVDALRFDRNDQLIALLEEYGYRVRQAEYLEDLKRVEREAAGIITKIKQLRSILPKSITEPKDDNLESMNESIIDAMAAYAAFLGISFDPYRISVVNFYSLEKQVKAKMQAIEQSKPKK